MNINEIIKEVAKAHNKTPEEVYSEMQMAIEAAFMSKDPEAQKEWAQSPFNGECPTPDEFINCLASMMMIPLETDA